MTVTICIVLVADLHFSRAKYLFCCPHWFIELCNRLLAQGPRQLYLDFWHNTGYLFNVKTEDRRPVIDLSLILLDVLGKE